MPEFIVPEKIKALQDFDPNLLQIGFEAVKNPEEDFTDFFETDEDIDEYLYQFGTDGMGGAFALWNPDGLSVGEPFHVVYFGSEGDFVAAAASIDDFLMLLSYDFVIADLIIGGSEVHYKTIMDAELIEEIKADQKAYSEWLKEKFGIIPDAGYKGILERAAKIFDRFDSWVEKRIDTGE
jgi:hypothetical protein